MRLKINTLRFCLFLLPLFSISQLTELQSAEKRTQRNRDYEAVQEFINSKRTIPLRDKASNFKISGTVRMNVILRNEYKDGIAQRGRNALINGIPRGFWDFDSELNIKTSYTCGKTYAKTRVQFYNPMGIEESITSCKQDPQGLKGSGRCNNICLREAYMGYKWLKTECNEVDFEWGRRRLYQYFDSRIQFNERIDGFVATWKRHVSEKSDVYIRSAIFIVDYRVNHPGYVTEIGIFNFYESQIDLKYSWIMWNKFGENICGTRNPIATFFNNSQWTAAYNFDIKALEQRAKFYGAFLINWDAMPLPEVNGSKQNIGWYAGFVTGDEGLNKAGEWAFDMNYQYVEAQAVSDRDARGTKRGNVRGETFTAFRRGNANYKGWHFEGVYNITKAFAVDVTYEFTHQIEKRLGGTHSYRKFEADFILAF
ncbi:MAG: hypothetical protein Tsb0021_02330 [Chlamydiales bacterium]